MDLDIIASVQEQHHRQLPLRARRLDGDAGRLDGRASSAPSSRTYIEQRARARPRRSRPTAAGSPSVPAVAV